MSFKQKIKQFGRQVWELFKTSVPSAIMLCCASSILLMLTSKEGTMTWNNTTLAWTIVCGVVALAYDGLVTYAQGGSAYEMLVSGNMKRMSASEFEGGYKISSHKYVKEYRPWKGFVAGVFVALWTILAGIFFGCNQSAIDTQKVSKFVAIMVIIFLLLSGWSIIPFYYYNLAGGSVSYFLSILFAILPIAVTGVMYIVGAYGKRNKALKAQELADRAAQAEANKPKKINYGGLPGTKPRKRK